MEKHEWSVYLWRYTWLLDIRHFDLWPLTLFTTNDSGAKPIEDACSSFLVWVCGYVGGGLPQCVVLISSCLHACRVTPLPGNTWPQHTSSRALHLPLWCILYTWYTLIQLQTLAHMPAVSDHGCAACNLAWMMVMIGFWIPTAIYLKRCSSTQTALWHLKSNVCVCMWEREREYTSNRCTLLYFLLYGRHLPLFILSFLFAQRLPVTCPVLLMDSLFLCSWRPI